MNGIHTHALPIPASGCGMSGPDVPAELQSQVAAAQAQLASLTGGGAFNVPTYPNGEIATGMAPGDPTVFSSERFLHSAAGGVIVGRDGEPAGRLPENSYLDTESGKIYGPDNKVIALPEGSKADFFDLPDIEDLVRGTSGGGAPGKVAGDSGGGAPGKVAGASGGGAPSKVDGAKGGGHDHHGSTTQVDGQWGPGGTTPMKGGKVAGATGGGEDCGMDHVAQGGGAKDVLPPGKLVGATTMAGGLSTAVGGASSLGGGMGLQDAIKELLQVLRELAAALHHPVVGGGPGQRPPVHQHPGQGFPGQGTVPQVPTTQVPPSDVDGATGSGPKDKSDTSTDVGGVEGKGGESTDVGGSNGGGSTTDGEVSTQVPADKKDEQGSTSSEGNDDTVAEGSGSSTT